MPDSEDVIGWTQMTKWFRRETDAPGLGTVGLLDACRRGTLSSSRPEGPEGSEKPEMTCPPILGGEDLAWQYDTLEYRLDLQPPAWPPQYFPPTAPVQSLAESVGPWSLVCDGTLPGGAMGGVPYGGGLPGDDGPLFGPNTTLVEMPWRAAGGEAHPMSTLAIGFFDEDTSELPQLLDRVVPQPASGSGTERLPIFESLVEETGCSGALAPPQVDWRAMLLAPLVPGQGSDPTEGAAENGGCAPAKPSDPDVRAGDHWSKAHTVRLPIIEQKRRADLVP